MEIYSIFVFVNLMPFKSSLSASSSPSLSEQCFLCEILYAISSSFYSPCYPTRQIINMLNFTISFSLTHWVGVFSYCHHKFEVVIKKMCGRKENCRMHGSATFCPCHIVFSSFCCMLFSAFYMLLCTYNLSYFTFSNYLLIIC